MSSKTTPRARNQVHCARKSSDHGKRDGGIFLMGSVNDFPRIHHRERQVTEARLEVERVFLEAIEKYDLTNGEQLRVVAELFSHTANGIARHMIREERHPGEDRPGGLE
jgi:hypothetical protein